jgi:2-dehydropantoate 2-reductase
MRFVVVGAGAVGGVVGGLLSRHGHDVAFVARGEHGATIADRGLTVRTPTGDFVVKATVAPTLGELGTDVGDVVLIAVKSNDTEGVLDDLAAAGPLSIRVVCLQNGVVNESLAAARFENVYGVPVMCPTLHLEPGTVVAYASPVAAILDVGRYPTGADDTAAAVAAAFEGSTIVSEVKPDIMRWKWAKLLLNLGNAIEAVCGQTARFGPLGSMIREEGESVLRAANIDFASAAEDAARRGDILKWKPSDRPGGSSWQSLARGQAIETDYLNGEIARLGARHGVATPLNEVLTRRANELAASGAGPGSVPVEEILVDAGLSA